MLATSPDAAPVAVTAADAVLQSPAVAGTDLFEFSAANARGIQKVHLTGCALAEPASARDPQSSLSTCSCTRPLRTDARWASTWAELLSFAIEVDAAARRTRLLEDRSRSFVADLDIEEFLDVNASLPLQLGPPLLDLFARSINDDLQGAHLRLVEQSDMLADPDLATALEVVSSILAPLKERYLTAMSRWPWRPLFVQAFGPWPVDAPDAFVITSRARIKAACSGMDDVDTTLEALALISTPVLGRAQVGKHWTDGMVAMRMPGAWAVQFRRYWLWSTSFPADLTPDRAQAVTTMMAAYDKPLGGPAEELIAALAATS